MTCETTLSCTTDHMYASTISINKLRDVNKSVWMMFCQLWRINWWFCSHVRPRWGWENPRRRWKCRLTRSLGESVRSAPDSLRANMSSRSVMFFHPNSKPCPHYPAYTEGELCLPKKTAAPCNRKTTLWSMLSAIPIHSLQETRQLHIVNFPKTTWSL